MPESPINCVVQPCKSTKTVCPLVALRFNKKSLKCAASGAWNGDVPL